MKYKIELEFEINRTLTDAEMDMAAGFIGKEFDNLGEDDEIECRVTSAKCTAADAQGGEGPASR